MALRATLADPSRRINSATSPRCDRAPFNCVTAPVEHSTSHRFDEFRTVPGSWRRARRSADARPDFRRTRRPNPGSVSRILWPGASWYTLSGVVGRGDLTNAEWALLEPLLPTGGRRGGRWGEHRRVIDGVLFHTRTGVPWRDLPARFGPWQTVYKRDRRWSADGTWERLARYLQVANRETGAGDRLRRDLSARLAEVTRAGRTPAVTAPGRRARAASPTAVPPPRPGPNRAGRTVDSEPAHGPDSARTGGRSGGPADDPGNRTSPDPAPPRSTRRIPVKPADDPSSSLDSALSNSDHE